MKLKKKYRIIKIDTFDYGDGRFEERKTVVGETCAVTEAQAVNNYCFRSGNRAGIADWYGDGCRATNYAAEEVTKND